MMTNEAFHAIHNILSLNLGDHESLVLFVHGQLLKRTLLLVLPAFGRGNAAAEPFEKGEIITEILLKASFAIKRRSRDLHKR